MTNSWIPRADSTWLREEPPGVKVFENRFHARDACADDARPDFNNRPVEARNTGVREVYASEIM